MSITRRRFLTGVGAGAVSLAAFRAHASTLHLEIPTVVGDEEDISAGELVFRITEDVSAVRFANTAGGLAYAPWESVTPRGTAYRRPWLFRGDGSRTEKRVWAEARIPGGSLGPPYTVVVSQAEAPRLGPVGAERHAPEFVGEPKNSHWLIRHDFKSRAHRWASYHDERGNVFYPCYHHPDGYAWNSHFERGPDKGETPLTCLAFHNYFRWLNPVLNDRSIVDCTFRCELAFEGNLKGATAHLFALMVDSRGGNLIPSSGRYHLVSPERSIRLPKDGGFGLTEFTVPSVEGWQARYLRNTSLDNAPPPDLDFVDGFGIAFHNFDRDALPEGVIKMRRFEFEFPTAA